MGNGNRVEFLVAVCALVTSIVAIWVAWDQSRVMRAQQHGMVYPVLQVDGFVSTREETLSMGIKLSNTGVGPALIQSVVASANGEPLQSLEPYREFTASGYDISWAGVAGRSLAPGSDFDALRLTWDRDEITPAQVQTTLSAWDEVDFEFCYCSVFDRCWTVRLDASRAESADSCAIQSADLFDAFGDVSVNISSPDPRDEATE